MPVPALRLVSRRRFVKGQAGPLGGRPPLQPAHPPLVGHLDPLPDTLRLQLSHRRRYQQYHTPSKLRANRESQRHARRQPKDGGQQKHIGLALPLQRAPVPCQQKDHYRQKDDIVENPVFSPAFHLRHHPAPARQNRADIAIIPQCPPRCQRPLAMETAPTASASTPAPPAAHTPNPSPPYTPAAAESECCPQTAQRTGATNPESAPGQIWK